MKINDYIAKIKKLGACGDALKDALNYETSEQLWDDCKRGDWMLWLIGKNASEAGCDKRKKLVLVACKCARLALPYVKEGELRPLKAIETAEQWAKGENNITLDDVRSAAACAADAAAYAAACAAACATDAAAYAAADAADAAASAAYAAACAAADAGKKAEIMAKCADIVRADYPDVDAIFGR